MNKTVREECTELARRVLSNEGNAVHILVEFVHRMRSRIRADMMRGKDEIRNRARLEGFIDGHYSGSGVMLSQEEAQYMMDAVPRTPTEGE